jgi:hypothetical protein
MAKTSSNFLDLRNKVINGGFDFWQRGTTVTTPTTLGYTADRWRVAYNGTIGTFTVSAQAFTAGQTAVPGNPTRFLRWDHTVAGSASTGRSLQTCIEDVRTFAGKTATVTFYAKADTARSVSVGFSQNFGVGGSATPLSIAQTVSLTTAWAKFTCTFTIPSISLAKRLELHITLV